MLTRNLLYRFNHKLATAVVAAFAIAGVLIPTVLTSAAPPTDFQTQLITGGLEGPAGMEIAPDGRIFVLERAGTVRIIKDEQLLAQPFVTFNSVASGDRGLIGVDFDPEFGVNNFWVYFYYTGQDLLNHIVRYDASTDVGLQGPFEVFTTQSPSQQLHVGGTIQFGPDGKLYFAVGDNGYPPNAQDLSNPHGKILRINKDGTIPTDNPFYGQPDKLGSIWAYGLRNPWRFQIDEQNGEIIGGDVGDFTWEEINRIGKGNNYGWPVHEGVCTQDCAGFTDPIYVYNHNGNSASVTGGPIYRGSMFPSEYQGSYFFADYAQGFIKNTTFNPDGSVDQVTDFDAAAGSVVDMKIADDGSMYYITYYPGRLYQVAYNTDNPAPTAIATSDVTRGNDVPFTVNFSAAQSSDPDDDSLTYAWDFGDGSTSTLEEPSHTYTQIGAYTVDLTVSDGVNTSNAIPIVIQVGQPPVITIATPTNGSTYKAGDTITYNLFATDAAGFDLNDADISTDIVFHHDTHTHPFIDNQLGRVGNFVIPDTGEASANTWYEIRVTASDSSGVSEVKSSYIYPEVVNMTYTAQPAGLNIELDGVPHATPYSVEQVVNFKRELNAPSVQTDAEGNVYQFKEWSDDGAVRHFVSAPDTDATVTALYNVTDGFQGEYFDNQTLSGTPVLTRQDPVVNFAWDLGSPDQAVPTDNFSVRWSDTRFFAEGRYKFTTATDDGVRLYIDDRLVIDKWIDQAATAWTHTEYLYAGEHDIRMEYYDNGYNAVAQLNWEATSDQTPPSVSGWRGEYYNNRTLTGSAAIIRGDTEIDFDWGLGSPDPAVNTDNFSARWTKTATFETATYRFNLTSDDGIRMYIDNKLVLDQWNDHGATTFSVEHAMSAGPHDIKVEYYENGFDAVAMYSAAKITGPPASNDYVAEYFVTDDLSGTPIVVDEAAVNHIWGFDAPLAGIPADNFSARWTKTALFSEGTYKFSVTADDGVRLYVDGLLLIDQWIDQGATTYTFNKALTTGEHTIVMEYYENGLDATAQLTYSATTEDPDPDPTPDGEPWHLHFYNNKTLSGPVIVDEHVYGPSLNLDWGTDAPYPGVPTDNFSAVIEKHVEIATTGVYKFTLSNDDGMRLFVDDLLYIDDWADQPANKETVNVALDTGEHTIRVEYYENGFDASVAITYDPTQEPADDPLSGTAGWDAEYFSNMTLSGQPLVTRNDSAVDFDWGLGAPHAALPVDGFSTKWTQTREYTTGTYLLSATSDDGIRVYVDSTLVIDEWNDHSTTTFIANVPLDGEHTITVEYYENAWDAVAKFSLTQL